MWTTLCIGVRMFLDPFCQQWLPGNNCMWLEYAAFGCLVTYASWRVWTRTDPEGNMTAFKFAMHTIGLIGMVLVVVLGLWGEGWLHGQLRLISRTW